MALGGLVLGQCTWYALQILPQEFLSGPDADISSCSKEACQGQRHAQERSPVPEDDKHGLEDALEDDDDTISTNTGHTQTDHRDETLLAEDDRDLIDFWSDTLDPMIDRQLQLLQTLPNSPSVHSASSIHSE